MQIKKDLTNTLIGILSLLVFCGSFSSCMKKNESESNLIPNNTPSREITPDNTILSESEVIVDTLFDIPDNVKNWCEKYDSRFGDGMSKKSLLTAKEISSLNKRISDAAPSVYDMSDYPNSVSGREVIGLIQKYNIPSGDNYDENGDYISYDVIKSLTDNRALSSVPETVNVKKAVIVSRCDLKSIPSDIRFFKKGDLYYDKTQETELIASFPVAVLHESADGKFLFVQSYFYCGWIPKNKAALCTDDEYMLFAKSSKYVTVISPEVKLGEAILNMGTVLPYVSDMEKDFIVLCPTIDNDKCLKLKKEKISKNDAVFSSLPYTMENFYLQAFKYENTPYCWGGMGGGVDCSGFVCAVFRSFGIYLPRNTGEQAFYSGTISDIRGLSIAQTEKLLDDQSYPTAMHRKGHVMLYLGEENGIRYIIHAPQGGQTVSVAPVDIPGNLTVLAVIH